MAKYQRFTMERLRRSQLTNHPKNPRSIDEYARERLRRNLKKVGLLEPPIWNRTTGHLVGGHQRLSVMDQLEDGDYELDVAVVELTEKQEREQLIALNNPLMQGDFLRDGLRELFLTPEFDFQAAGYDPLEVQIEFAGDADLSKLFGPPPEPKPASDEKKAQSKARIQDMRQNLMQNLATENDPEFITVVVFQSSAQRERFMAGLGLEPSDRYVDGARVAHKAGIALGE